MRVTVGAFVWEEYPRKRSEAGIQPRGERAPSLNKEGKGISSRNSAL